MQPRQGVEVQEVVKESPTAAEVSAVEVQPEGPVEVVLESAEGNSAGGALETKGVQNLESKPQEAEIAAENPENEPIVAQTVDFEPVPAVSRQAIDTLAACIEESKAASGAPLAPDDPRNFTANSLLCEDDEAAGSEVDKVTVYRKTPDGEYVEMPGAEDWLASNAPGSRLSYHPPMGPLSSGDTRSTVLVREGYWEGVESAAKADGVSVEEWLTRELGERLEDTFFGRR